MSLAGGKTITSGRGDLAQRMMAFATVAEGWTGGLGASFRPRGFLTASKNCRGGPHRADEAERLGAELLDLFLQGLKLLFPTHGQSHSGLLTGEEQRRLPPNPAARSGHDDHLPAEVFTHGSSPVGYTAGSCCSPS